MADGARPRVVVIEDSDSIRETTLAAFEDAGFDVFGAFDGDRLEDTLSGFRPDVLILDVMLPGARDGFELIDVIRQRTDAGIIMLTARDELSDRLHGLAVGADDYVIKPFQLAEVVARAHAVMRRRGRGLNSFQVDDLVVDTASGVVTRGGAVLDLTGTELRLVTYLVEHRGRTVSKPQILEAVWGYGAYDTNLVEVHVSALRRKMEANGRRLVHTVRGIGYTVKVPK